MSRTGYFVLAWCCVGLGIIGAFLPVMPTTIFIIIAAWAFAKSSPEREQWLLNHARFGPALRNWREHRVIPLRAKCMAYSMITLSGVFAMFMLNAKPYLLAITLICLTAVVIYIHRQPSVPGERSKSSS